MSERGGEAVIEYGFVTPLGFSRAMYANGIKECIILRLLQEMYRLGYDLQNSAEMTAGSGCGLNCKMQTVLETSTLFFKHSGIEDRKDVPLMCVAPFGDSHVTLLRYTDNIEKSVRQVIGACWPRGIHHEGLKEISGEVLKVFALNGRPWSGSCGDDEYIDSRFMFIQLLTNFALQQWKVKSAINMRGHPDIFFFTPSKSIGSEYDFRGGPCSSIGLMSVTRNNVLRLVNFDSDMAAVVKATIMRYFQVGDDSFLEQHDFSGVTEFDFRGEGMLICSVLRVVVNSPKNIFRRKSIFKLWCGQRVRHGYPARMSHL